MPGQTVTADDDVKTTARSIGTSEHIDLSAVSQPSACYMGVLLPEHMRPGRNERRSPIGSRFSSVKGRYFPLLEFSGTQGSWIMRSLLLCRRVSSRFRLQEKVCSMTASMEVQPQCLPRSTGSNLFPDGIEAELNDVALCYLTFLTC